jgi:hypothetical protein
VIAHAGRCARGYQARVEVVGVERPHANGELGSALLVASPLPPLGQLIEVLLGVGEQALPRGDLGQLQQR